MRSILCNAILASAFTVVAAFGADHSLGTWKLDLGKTKFSPGPTPIKSLTVTRDAADGGVKVTITGEQADGTPVNSTYTAKYDGKEVPVTGNAPYDMIAIKQVNANTFTDERRKSGASYKGAGHTVISNGGKTMKTTVRGTNADGKSMNNTLVFDKQ